MLVGVNPGGNIDRMARLIEPGMSELLGVTITVENVPGANTTIANAVAFSEGDDCSVMVMNNFPAITFGLTLEDVDFDFEYMYPAAAVQATPAIIVVPGNSAYQTMDDLIEAMRAAPGRVSASVFSSSSNNALGLLQMEELLGVDINIIDYNGGNPARIAVVSGEVDFSHSSVFAALSLIQSGELRVLAAHQTEAAFAPFRAIPEFADTPLLGEATGLNFGSNLARLGLTVNQACKDEFPQRYEKIVAAAAQTMASPEYLESLEELGLELSPLPLTPEEFWQSVLEERDAIDRIQQ